MGLYSYVLASDTGFAPNPYWGYCTLATCKPQVRRAAKVGDWVVGTGSARTVGNNSLVYAMKVSEVMDFDRYYRDARFAQKKPAPGSAKGESGDNMYYRDKGGQWRRDSGSCRHLSAEQMLHDTSVDRVLIGREYFYFGGKAMAIPSRFQVMVKKGPGHKSDFPPDFVDAFVKWLKASFSSGFHDGPSEVRTPGSAADAGPTIKGKLSPRNGGVSSPSRKSKKC